MQCVSRLRLHVVPRLGSWADSSANARRTRLPRPRVECNACMSMNTSAHSACRIKGGVPSRYACFETISVGLKFVGGETARTHHAGPREQTVMK